MVRRPFAHCWAAWGARAAAEWPTHFVAFDLLRLSGTDQPWSGLRAVRLEAWSASWSGFAVAPTVTARPMFGSGVRAGVFPSRTRAQP
ncbi:hypothetical protein ACWEWG_35280 [Streptomyces sp. NPDC003758]